MRIIFEPKTSLSLGKAQRRNNNKKKEFNFANDSIAPNIFGFHLMVNIAGRNITYLKPLLKIILKFFCCFISLEGYICNYGVEYIHESKCFQVWLAWKVWVIIIFNQIHKKNKLIKKLCVTVSDVDQLPLMGTPYPLLGILAVYLWFVKIAGPRFDLMISIHENCDNYWVFLIE